MAEISSKSINEFKNILFEEIRAEINNRLDESLSSKLYHFCSLESAESILKDGRFHLSNVDRHKTEAGLAKSVSQRGKAVFPFKKVVEFNSELPQTESDGTIYKVKKTQDGNPNNACYIFKNGSWNYLPGSENANMGAYRLNKGLAMSTELGDGRVSYVRDSEKLMGEYYMCFSRVPGAFDGYSGRMAASRWRGVYVRFSINGDVLNSRYKGGPVNFYSDYNKIKDNKDLKDAPTKYAEAGNASRFAERERPTTQAYGADFANQIDRIKAYEHEDRLFSNEQDIPSKKRPNDNIFNTGIVTRIDIFVDKMILNSKAESNLATLSTIGDVLKLCKKYGALKKVHIYDKEKGVSLLPIQNEIDKAGSQYIKNKLYDKFADYIELNRADLQKQTAGINSSMRNKDVTLTNKEAQCAANLLGIICYGNFNDEQSYRKAVAQIIKAYGLDKFAAKIMENLPTIKDFDEKQSGGWFAYAIKIIWATLNEIRGQKIKLLGDRLKKLMYDYAAKRGLGNKKFSIVTHKKRQWEKRHGINFVDKRKKAPVFQPAMAE